MGQKTFLFDLDGTLTGSMPAVLKIIDIISEEYEFKINKRDALDTLRNKGIKKVFEKFKIPFYKIPGLVKKYRIEYKKEIPFLKPAEGIRAVIVKLKDAGVKMGIITTNGRNNVVNFLESNQLDFFDYIYADVGIFGKSRTIKRIIKLHRLDPSNTFFIGDETRDIEAAKKAGIKSIAVTWGLQTRISLQKENPDYILNNPDELLGIS